MSKLPELNPYATPSTVPVKPLAYRPPRRTPWLRGTIALQAVVIVVSLAVEAYSHESIIGSGPIFSLVGLMIAVLAVRLRDPAAMVFGGSAVVFTSLIVFLINYNGWGPPQGNLPITLLAFTYAAFALPAAAWLVLAPAKSAEKHPGQDGENTVVAVETPPSTAAR